MRKVIAPVLFFLISILAFFSVSYTYAQEEEATPGAVITTITPSPVETVEYTLAYPGILPDNPLHFLKAARDRIISFLINDSIKKAEFNLLTSDKRLYAAELLLAKEKHELAITTLSKSNNYFHNALGATAESLRMGKNVDIVLSNLELALKKRYEIFLRIENSFDEELTNQLQEENRELDEFQKTLNELRPSL